MFAVEFKPEYGYVLMSVGFSFILNTYQTVLVVKARRQYDVNYPDLYAPESHKHAKAFNSVQRGHQNTLESLAPLQVATVLSGLAYPVYAAGMFTSWCLTRFAYAYNYASGDPSKRVVPAALGHIPEFGLILMTFYAGAKLAGLV
eukprot:GFYU01001744.1.p1 GENE.GFYU01001744.1~~GFYU01001744.1.p1  ORF type:complete len:145 (-),score=31.61 GFYU01001744.1:305-739(-)